LKPPARGVGMANRHTNGLSLSRPVWSRFDADRSGW
jgi:hypothetical protein